MTTSQHHADIDTGMPVPRVLGLTVTDLGRLPQPVAPVPHHVPYTASGYDSHVATLVIGAFFGGIFIGAVMAFLFCLRHRCITARGSEENVRHNLNTDEDAERAKFTTSDSADLLGKEFVPPTSQSTWTTTLRPALASPSPHCQNSQTNRLSSAYIYDNKGCINSLFDNRLPHHTPSEYVPGIMDSNPPDYTSYGSCGSGSSFSSSGSSYSSDWSFPRIPMTSDLCESTGVSFIGESGGEVRHSLTGVALIVPPCLIHRGQSQHFMLNVNTGKNQMTSPQIHTENCELIGQSQVTCLSPGLPRYSTPCALKVPYKLDELHQRSKREIILECYLQRHSESRHGWLNVPISVCESMVEVSVQWPCTAAVLAITRPSSSPQGERPTSSLLPVPLVPVCAPQQPTIPHSSANPSNYIQLLEVEQRPVSSAAPTIASETTTSTTMSLSLGDLMSSSNLGRAAHLNHDIISDPTPENILCLPPSPAPASGFVHINSDTVSSAVTTRGNLFPLA